MSIGEYDNLQAGMVTLSIMPGCHESPVLQVDLKPTMLRVVSCSKSSSRSLLIRHLRPQSGGIDNPVTMPSVTLRTGPVSSVVRKRFLLKTESVRMKNFSLVCRG